MFQSYQSKQINPDQVGSYVYGLDKEVSIVSIQTDQSRHYESAAQAQADVKFQSYQSKQINPDWGDRFWGRCNGEGFQSYQSKQINPDHANRSQSLSIMEGFQSYQSKQINPD